MSDATRPLFHRGRLLANRALGVRTFDPETCPLYHHVNESLGARVQDLALSPTFAKRILIYGTRTHTLSKICSSLFPDAYIVHADWCKNALPNGAHTGLVSWEEDLPFAPASFDIILSCLTLQICENPHIALQRIHALLRPGGLFLTQFMGGASLSTLREALIEADLATSAGARPRTIPMLDMQTTLSLFQGTGFTSCICDEERITISFKSLEGLRSFVRSRGAQSPFMQKAPPRRAFYRHLQNNLTTPFVPLDLITCLGWHTRDAFPALPLVDAP